MLAWLFSSSIDQLQIWSVVDEKLFQSATELLGIGLLASTASKLAKMSDKDKTGEAPQIDQANK